MKTDPRIRFWAMVDVGENEDCWLWIAVGCGAVAAVCAAYLLKTTLGG